MTIPNLLTLGRILLTPVLAWLLLENKLRAALVVFFVAGATDALDGFIARVFNQKSRFGAFIDPLADKFLLVTSFVILAYIGLIPFWLTAIAIGRDAMILCGVLILVLCRVKVEIRPLVSSKLTTFFQLLAILAMLGSWLVALPGWAYTGLFAVTAAVSVFSGVQYLRLGIFLLGQGRSQGADS